MENQEQVQKKSKKKKVLTVVLIVIGVLIAIGIISSLFTEKENYYIGDNAIVNNIDFVVNKVENTKSVGSQYLGETTNYNFMLVYITVKNNSNSEIMLINSSFYLYKDDAQYETHYAGIYIDDGFYIHETIGAGISKNIVLLYETPNKHTDDTYQLSIKAKGNSKRIILTQKNIN